jgi:hypothetical protein
MRRALALAALTLLGCGGGEKLPLAGTEGGSCLPKDWCAEGLTCLSTFCVRVVLPDAGGGFDGAAGAAGVAGTSGAAGMDAAAGAGGGAVAGSPADAGPEVLFTPAPHPDLPQVGTAGGPVLVAPKVLPIIYAAEPATTDILAALQELAHTPYWAATTSEYGVGPLTILPPILLPTPAPSVNTDASLQAQLVAATSGANPTWGVADPSVVYLYVIPPGANVNIQNASCCDDFGGYHSEVASGGVAVPYAVVCSCPGFLGNTVGPLDERTTAMSHELVEAATDPFPFTNPAFGVTDRADIVWTVINGGGETADMCAFNDDAFVVPKGSTYMVQRSWSNAAAKRMDNPCVPYPPGPLYFNSFPALEPILYTTDRFPTKGLKIPLGQSRTIDVTLSSNGPTKGPWSVKAHDYTSWFFGGQPKLKLVLDKGNGVNGDVVHLTVTPLAVDQSLQGEIFILYSQFGATVRDPDYQTNLTVGLVVQ